jgi:fructoselysine-6-P-deglycase FrlB-like protein
MTQQALIGMSSTNETSDDRPMLADMRRQAQALSALLDRRDEFAAQGRVLHRNGGLLFGFGSGDGWFAARAAAEHARLTLGLPFQAAASLEMLAYQAPSLAADDAAVAISMSGSADRTNEAAEAIRRQEATLLALTNGAGGELARIAGGKISLEVADLAPFLTGTTKYTATLLGLLMLLEGAAGREESALPTLIAALPAMVSAAEDFARRCTAPFAAAPPTGIRILSAGPNLATAEYAMAKFIKLVTVPVWADEVEEFAHRQFWSCPATDLVIYIAANPAVARCADASAAALASMGMRTIAIDTPNARVPSAGARFTVPCEDERLSPLMTAIPLQFLAYFLARALGGNPDVSQEVGDPARFHAAQLLSRRGELEPARR